ncbi:hypothetical protein [Actinotalea sp. K2]|nr:hypothetical protein [Actinotalea sp. K2]MCL3859605.1 hypothetical protein [Actinotalea sp. K2]
MSTDVAVSRDPDHRHSILSWLRHHPEYVDVVVNAPSAAAGNEVLT